MKKLFLLFATTCSIALSFAQVNLITGPALDNDRDIRMYKMLGGDDSSLYSYRIKTRGRGTSYFIEKTNKSSLTSVFVKEIPFEEKGYCSVKDIQYAANTVFVFFSRFYKKTDRMTLSYQAMSAEGDFLKEEVVIVDLPTNDHDYLDFLIQLNPSRTKFLVKTVYKSSKNDSIKTNFSLFENKTMTKIWTKELNARIGRIGPNYMMDFGTNKWKTADWSFGFVGLYLDNQDNIFYATAYHLDHTFSNESSIDFKKQKPFKLEIGLLEAAASEPKTRELAFDENCLIKDVRFTVTPKNQLVVGGFLKDILERKGRDGIEVGMFNFTIDIATGEVASSTIKIFDKPFLNALESSVEKSRFYNFKLDYIFPIGDDIFYVGEQYSEEEQFTYTIKNANGTITTRTTTSPQFFFNSQKTSIDYVYNFMDVIVAKLNSKGEFEWIKNTPLRNSKTLFYRHLHQTYIAIPSDKSIIIMNNEQVDNTEAYKMEDFNPISLKTVNNLYKSNFVYSSVEYTDGEINHDLIFYGDTFCFDPIRHPNLVYMPGDKVEIYTTGNPNEIFLYTERYFRDRFVRIKFD